MMKPTQSFRPTMLSGYFPRHNPYFLSNKYNSLFHGLILASKPNVRTLPLTIIRATDNSNQGNSDASNHKKVTISANVSNLTKALLNFTMTNFLPIGLKLKGGEFRAVSEAWPAGIFGLASILLLSPFFSSLISQVNLAPREFVTGLAIFSCMPTTLSSGVALTQLVDGNSALALALTVMSNLLGILTVPFWISKFFTDDFGVAIPTRELFWSLILTLLIPLILGKVVRNMLKGLATFIDQNQRIFSMLSTILLSLTPWMQVSKSRPLLLMVKPQVFILAIGMGILVHLTLLGFNTVAIKSMSSGFCGSKSVFSKKENFRALLIVCSQKALLIVVAVVEQLGGALGESGLLVLPCVAAHINQVIIDSLLVNFWLQKDRSYSKKFEA
ncbi:probable sodium/metabolite cotransporter BASS4, chloroplastic isoform X2 [Quercus robur]|uniref:probable sodium/metabolite cotransporter BASS4, chloroplastic isoform X2 n=1 Tax=Quercus robur TaxID=38942 RepID=UPI00216118A2|nr:probable sodium/metabolite cotransporter BASS4, chloroplastic isoform X2 [Quercus robur]